MKFQRRANKTLIALIFPKYDQKKGVVEDDASITVLKHVPRRACLSAAPQAYPSGCTHVGAASIVHGPLPLPPCSRRMHPLLPKSLVVLLVASECKTNHFLKIQFPITTGLRKNLKVHLVSNKSHLIFVFV